MPRFVSLLVILFILAANPFSILAAEAQQEHFDVLIRDAFIYDGKSLEGFKGDVGLRGEIIAKIGNLENAQAPLTIKAKGLTLAPGFIDAHTHSDFNPMIYPDLNNKIEQGVTTEIVGNCGMSAAPVLGLHYRHIRTVWAREGVNIPSTLPWTSFLDYQKSLEANGMKTNFVALVGHGNLRSAVMGMDPRPATLSEIEEMKKLLAQSMKEGAYGISFGLVYLPGIFAKEDEIVELCRESAKHVGVCAFHMRSEGATLLESIKEVIRIAEKSQASVQISHLKAGGKKNWAKIDQAFELIEEARLRGVRVEADAYPYTAGFAELGVMLPDSLFKREDRVAYFQDILKRKELLDILRKYDDEKMFNWDRVMIASTPHKRYWKYEGKTLKQISREENIEPEKLLVDILADTSFEASAFYFSQDQSVVDKVLVKPYVAIGSDSIADGSRRPHPRAYGTFPRMFEYYVRSKKTIQIGNVIRKMTSLPAEHFNLENRGQVKEGYFADLILFDAGDLTAKADYKNPTVSSKGVKWVFVNGKAVFQNAKTTQEKSGRFLKRTLV